MTIVQAFEQFLYDRSSYCSDQTIIKYKGDCKVFFRFLTEVYQFDASSSGFDDLPEAAAPFKEFIIWLRSRSMRSVTIRSYCRTIKTFLRYCYEEDLCKDYLKKVKLPKDDSRPKMPLYQDEVARIDGTFDHNTIRGSRNYCIFHLMLDCGLRRQEVIHLQCEHINYERNILDIVESKGNKSRFVLVPDFLLDAISSYLKMAGHSSGTVFVSLRSDDPLSDNAVKMLFQDLKKASGIPRLHAHLLRHTFATSYLVGGGNLEFLRVFLGHYDYTVTKNYSQMAAQLKMLGADIYKLDPIFFTRGY